MFRPVFIALFLAFLPALIVAQPKLRAQDGFYLSKESALQLIPDVVFDRRLRVTGGNAIDENLLQGLLESTGNEGRQLTIADIWGLSYDNKPFIAIKRKLARNVPMVKKKGIAFYELMSFGKIGLFYVGAQAYVFRIEDTNKFEKISRKMLKAMMNDDPGLIAKMMEDDNNQSALVYYIVEYNRTHPTWV